MFDGTPGLGIAFITAAAHGEKIRRDHLSALHTEASGNGPQNMQHIVIDGGMTVHIDTQVLMDAGLGEGDQTGRFYRQVIIQAADLLDGSSGIETFKQGFYFFPTVDMFINVSLIFPALLNNKADHGFEQHGISTRTHRQMNICPLRGFGKARVNHDQPTVGISFDLLEQFPGAWFLVAHPAVPAPGYHRIRPVRIRHADQRLFAQDTAVYPVYIGKFLGYRIIKITGSKQTQKAQSQPGFHLPAGIAPSHVSKCFWSVLFPDRLHFIGDFLYRLFPTDPFMMIPDFFKRIRQPVGIMDIGGNTQTFTAAVSFTARIGLVSPHLGDPVVLYQYFQSAILSTKHTPGLFPISHFPFPFRQYPINKITHNKIYLLKYPICNYFDFNLSNQSCIVNQQLLFPDFSKRLPSSKENQTAANHILVSPEV